MSELLEMLSGLLSVMNRDAVKHIGAKNTFIVSLVLHFLIRIFVLNFSLVALAKFSQIFTIS